MGDYSAGLIAQARAAYWSSLMHIRNAARALLLAETLATFFAQTVEAQDRHQQLQFCWSVGTFDKTVYFAESLQLDSRLASFTEMLDISAIDHTAVECRY